MRKLLLAVSLLIIYGSLYPFNFNLASYDASMLPGLFSFGLGDVGRGDFLSNIVLFVPFGFFAMQSVEGRAGWRSWLVILGAGFILAHAIQVIQLIVPGRIPSGSDSVLNLLGCALGCLLGMLRMPRVVSLSDVSAGPLPVPTLLAIFLLVWNLRPFVPSLDLQLLIDNIKHLVVSPAPQPLWTFQNVLVWLIIFHFLKGGGVKLIPEKYYPALAFGTLGLGFFIVGNSITVDRVLGPLIALPLWQVFRGMQRPLILSVLTFILLVGIGFTPFELRDVPGQFNWTPFSGALGGGNMIINVLATSKKMLFYGCLIYLLVETSLRLRTSTLIVSIFLFFSELLQVYFQHKSPEITDSILALMIGIGFYVWEDYRSRTLSIAGLPGVKHEDAFGSHGLSGDETDLEKENMRENGGLQDQAADEKEEHRAELTLNLHRAQVKFLQRVAAATDMQPSEVCQRLIGLALQPESEWQQDLLCSQAVQNEVSSLSRESGDGRWAQLPIHLDATHVDSLSAYAAASSTSNSKAMRHLLADYMSRFSAPPQSGRKTRESHSHRQGFLKSNPYFLIAGVSLLGALSVIVLFAMQEGRSIRVGPHWAGNVARLILDPHTHTRFSDGALAPADLVELAVESGCDALVISDHSDTKGTLSDQQMLELDGLRDKYPDLLLFNGIELNMPSYGGREHATLIADPLIEVSILRQLKDMAERSINRGKNAGASVPSDRPLLQAIADHQSLRNGLLLIYNHPARKDVDIAENLSDLNKWNASSQVFAAIEGAPGHQNADVIGSYKEPYLTEDRWDPVVAEVGGVWDQLLSGGHQIWAALASSDYHNKKLDKAPCAFSRTHLIVPEWSYRGVLMALKAGTYWADHGRILNQLWFSVVVDGLEQAAYPGYTVYVGDRDSLGIMTLSIERGPGSVGQPLTVEFIGNCQSGETEVLAIEEIDLEATEVSAFLPLAATGLDEQSCIVRARVRLSQGSTTDYLAYTNPIRFILD